MTKNEAIVLSGPEQIEFARMASIKCALKLELKTGLRHSRGSVLAVAKRLYGLKGSKQVVYEALCKMVEDAKAKHGQPVAVDCPAGPEGGSGTAV